MLEIDWSCNFCSVLECVACMGKQRNAHKVWRENLKEGDCLRWQGVDGRVMIKWILKEIEWEVFDWICPAEGRDK